MSLIEHKPASTKTKPAPPPNKPNPYYVPPPSKLDKLNESLNRIAILESIRPVEVKFALAPNIAIKPEVVHHELTYAIGNAIMKQYPNAVKLSSTKDSLGYIHITAELKIFDESE